MKSLLVFFLLTLFSTAFSSAEETPSLFRLKRTDAEIRRQLTGHWTNLQRGFRGHLGYAPDGKASCELTPVDFFTKTLFSSYSFQGSWKVKDGLLYTKVTSSTSKKFPLGTTYRDEILELTDTSMTLRNEKQLVTRFDRVQE